MGGSSDPSADTVTEPFVCLAEPFVCLTGSPNGSAALVYSNSDAPAFAEATLPQHRVTKLCPRTANRADLGALFRSSLRAW